MSTLKTFNLQHPSSSVINTTLESNGAVTANTARFGNIQSIGGNISLPAGHKIVAADGGALVSPGTPIQTVKKVWDSNSGQLSWSGNYNWQAWTASDLTVTAKGANSLWVVYYTFAYATRYGATSVDIFYSINGGTVGTLSGQSTTGGNEAGSYGLGTIWYNNGPDIWTGATINAANPLTHAAGASIKFTVYGRNGGPGGDNTTGTQVLGHPWYNGVAVVMEIAQ